MIGNKTLILPRGFQFHTDPPTTTSQPTTTTTTRKLPVRTTNQATVRRAPARTVRPKAPQTTRDWHKLAIPTARPKIPRHKLAVPAEKTTVDWHKLAIPTERTTVDWHKLAAPTARSTVDWHRLAAPTEFAPKPAIPEVKPDVSVIPRVVSIRGNQKIKDPPTTRTPYTRYVFGTLWSGCSPWNTLVDTKGQLEP